jgi:hypothetical protein
MLLPVRFVPLGPFGPESARGEAILVNLAVWVLRGRRYDWLSSG